MKKMITICIGISVIALLIWIGMRPQTEVAWEKFIKLVNKTVGEEDVKIKELEIKYSHLKEKWESQVFVKHQFSVLSEQNKDKAVNLEEEVSVLEQKLTEIRSAINSGGSYTGKTGKEYQQSELSQLEKAVSNLITRKKKEIDNKSQYAENYQKYANQASILQSNANETLEDLRIRIEGIKEKRNELILLKEQVELAKDITNDVTLNYESISSDINHAVTDIETKVRTNEELLNIYMNELPSDKIETSLKDF